MKNFKWITGVSILLFLVASAMPAYSAKPWPQGGDKGPKGLDDTFVALTDDTCQNFFDVAEMHIDALGYTANKRDLKEGTTYPMPVTYELEDGVEVRTPYKDQAGMAWDTYRGMWSSEVDKDSDAAGKIDSVIAKFLANVSYYTDDEGDNHIIDGGRITGDDLQGVYNDLADLRDCVSE